MRSRSILLDIDLAWSKQLTKKQARAQIRIILENLWQVQKNAMQERADWLENNARDIARAEGELNWKKTMDDISKLAKERGVKRKTTCAIKGTQRILDRIEVPKYDWFYSSTTKEITHYDEGVFEAYAARTPQSGLCPTHPVSFTPTIILR